MLTLSIPFNPADPVNHTRFRSEVGYIATGPDGIRWRPWLDFCPTRFRNVCPKYEGRSEPVESVESLESLESVESVEPVESIESLESVEPVESVEPPEAVEVLEVLEVPTERGVGGGDPPQPPAGG